MDWNALFNYLGTGGGLIVLLNWLAGLPLLKRRKAAGEGRRVPAHGRERQ